MTHQPSGVGKMKNKPKFTQVFSKVAAINYLSAARFFLFASRDVWFVVGLPVFLYEVLQWSLTQIGTFMALWVIAYGLIQAFAPRILRSKNTSNPPGGHTARLWAFILVIFPFTMVLGLYFSWPSDAVIIIGLTLFGIVFAINSALHSYLILAYSDHDKVAMTVGFYYMANAGGRLMGTVISGLAYQQYGLIGCLIGSTVFVLIAALISIKLPEVDANG
ncbi:hypothetical protein [sulfur-oxidizing endosymbiont of Gigantopelta aegis]|uniref:hypothetical protein n=1 Tax=sulfur-oxidizing endosymbiont of Gigantopelta aegis TaxID=2794934 RepID=UPI0018DE8C54